MVFGQILKFCRSSSSKNYKSCKDFAKRLDFKDIKCPERHSQKFKKKNSIGISVFGYENKVKYPIYVSNKCKHKHVDLLLIGAGKKEQYVLIKDCNTFMYYHTLLHGRKHFCC